MATIKCNFNPTPDPWHEDDENYSNTCVHRDEEGYCTLDKVVIGTAESHYPYCESASHFKE